MEEQSFIGPFTGTQFYDDDSKPMEETDETTIGFISFEMLDRLIALKVAEGHGSFEALFEKLLEEHEQAKALAAKDKD
jgi:hypothetical protein